MEPNQTREFRQQIELLCAAFDKQISETLIDVYFAGLADLPMEMIARAVAQAVRTLKFFPKVAELRELCEGSQTERATRAWQLLMEAVDQGGHYNSLFVDDQALASAIRRTFSHWIDIPNELPPPHDPMHASLFNRFCGNYRLAEKTGERTDCYFVGFYEATNRQQVSQFSLTPAGLQRIADVVELGDEQARELPCVVEPVHEPTFRQKVVVIAGGKVEMREMEFSRLTGTLTAAARSQLTGSSEPVRQLRAAAKQLTA